MSLSFYWIVSFLSFSVFGYNQPDSLPQTWPKRREWNLHGVYKHRKRNFEDLYYQTWFCLRFCCPRVNILGPQNWFSGNLGRDAATSRWEGTIELNIPACCSILDVSVTHLYHPRASQIPVTAQDFWNKISPQKLSLVGKLSFSFGFPGRQWGRKREPGTFLRTP